MASLSAPQIRLVDLCSTDVTDRAAFLQNRVEILIGCQAELEIINIKKDYLYQIILYYKSYSKLNLY